MDPRPNQHQLLYCNCISTVTNLYPIVKSCRVARSSVLRSKTLPQGEFISPEDFLSSRVPEKASLFWDGDPYRIRTDVNGVRGRCLNHLTNGPYLASWGSPLDGAPIQWDGTPSGTRTLDTLIKSQVLYQLS